MWQSSTQYFLFTHIYLYASNHLVQNENVTLVCLVTTEIMASTHFLKLFLFLLTDIIKTWIMLTLNLHSIDAAATQRNTTPGT